MVRRDREKVPWVIRLSPIFEAAYWKRLGDLDHDAFLDVFDSFESLALKNPKQAGVQHPEVEGIWVYESPNLQRLRSVVIIFTIDDAEGYVNLCNIFPLNE